MTISKDLFLAILSMDAYNRSYGAGIVLAGTQIGMASITTDSERVFEDPNAPPETPTVAEDAGFYGVAYEIMQGEQIEGMDAGQTVISYRGTDDNLGELGPVDFHRRL